MKFISVVAMCMTLAVSSHAATASKKAKENKPEPQVEFSVQTIELKGVRLGMLRSEVESITGDYMNYEQRNFTIGDVATDTNKPPLQDYIDGKLSSFFFTFQSSSFSDVLGAVKSKYPSLACHSTEIRNGFGAVFPSVECVLHSADGRLTLKKYGVDLNSSYLALTSNEQLEAEKKAKEKSSADI